MGRVYSGHPQSSSTLGQIPKNHTTREQNLPLLPPTLHPCVLLEPKPPEKTFVITLQSLALRFFHSTSYVLVLNMYPTHDSSIIPTSLSKTKYYPPNSFITPFHSSNAYLLKFTTLMTVHTFQMGWYDKVFTFPLVVILINNSSKSSLF